MKIDQSLDLDGWTWIWSLKFSKVRETLENFKLYFAAKYYIFRWTNSITEQETSFSIIMISKTATFFNVKVNVTRRTIIRIKQRWMSYVHGHECISAFSISFIQNTPRDGYWIGYMLQGNGPNCSPLILMSFYIILQTKISNMYFFTCRFHF